MKLFLSAMLFLNLCCGAVLAADKAPVKLTIDEVKQISAKELCFLAQNKGLLEPAAVDLVSSEIYSRGLSCSNANLAKVLPKDTQKEAVNDDVDDEDFDALMNSDEVITEEDIIIAKSVDSPKCRKFTTDSTEYVKCNLEELNNSEPEAE